ncbi:DUF2721 domain-containing protein [Candidatus Marinamargulisbacteria bacterium SCGC AG-410-N11]|nr:DUF2721 domain-containing protein [Candidatus Marinamargulisbacteria bacterium SCGC AG-410-N11]
MITLTTPSILFPAITLLMLAYTNRFLALSQLIRSLHSDYHQNKSLRTLKQINHLRTRVFLIRFMQGFGALSIILCTISIFSLLLHNNKLGLYFFVFSLLTFLISILSSLIEIIISSKALNILLSDLEDNK